MTSSSSAFVPDPPLSARRAFRPAAARGAPGDAAAGPSEGEPAAPSAAPHEPTADPSYERGLAEGLARGREEGAAQARASLPIEDLERLRAASTALDEAARGITALRRGYWLENRKILVALAVAVAERIVRRELATDPDALAPIVERALSALGDASPVQLRLAPAVTEALADGRAVDLAALAAEHGLRVEADPRLSPGDARVLAERTSVDARLSESLRRIAEELRETAEHALADGAPGGEAHEDEAPRGEQEDA